MALTLDLWPIPPESARRVGHPAPFPVELPAQLIRLYTFKDDLVLDPFMGSGTSLVAAAKLGRRYVGYDLDPAYVEIARRRVAEAVGPAPAGEEARGRPEPSLPEEEDFENRALREGKAGQKLAEEVLVEAGFSICERDRRLPRTGVAVSFVATDGDGDRWYFDFAGAFTSHRGGLVRTETVWRALGRASAVRGRLGSGARLVLLTTQLPRRPSKGDSALRAAGPEAFFDAVDVLSEEGRERLKRYAKGGTGGRPLAGFWQPADLRRAKG